VPGVLIAALVCAFGSTLRQPAAQASQLERHREALDRCTRHELYGRQGNRPSTPISIRRTLPPEVVTRGEPTGGKN
jgi:hypothetical protein